MSHPAALAALKHMMLHSAQYDTQYIAGVQAGNTTLSQAENEMPEINSCPGNGGIE